MATGLSEGLSDRLSVRPSVCCGGEETCIDRAMGMKGETKRERKQCEHVSLKSGDGLAAGALVNSQ